MRNIEKPKTVSLETALQNLVSRLTGAPAAGLPRTGAGGTGAVPGRASAQSGGIERQ